jgi:hypothetical protein
MPVILISEEDAFSVSIDIVEARLELVFRGFWDASTVTRLADTLQRARYALLGDGAGGYVTLVDNSAFQVQGQGVVDALVRLAGAEIAAGKIATVVTSALLRRQAQRVGPDHGLFETRAEALRWLADD